MACNVHDDCLLPYSLLVSPSASASSPTSHTVLRAQSAKPRVHKTSAGIVKRHAQREPFTWWGRSRAAALGARPSSIDVERHRLHRRPLLGDDADLDRVARADVALTRRDKGVLRAGGEEEDGGWGWGRATKASCAQEAKRRAVGGDGA
eukprot:5946685-Prymnesium_polylepis.1